MDPPLSTVSPARRRFLISGLASLLAGIAPLGYCLGSEKEDTAHDPPGWLKLTGDRDAVLRFGEAYLRSHPEERELEALVAEIEKPVPGDGELNESTSSQTGHAAMLDRRVRDDYRRGELVAVSGWLLSRTEARLYAAAAMFYANDHGASRATPDDERSPRP